MMDHRRPQASAIVSIRPHFDFSRKKKIPHKVKAEAEIIMEKTTQKATFAAGCFWGVESTFRQVKGVVATAVGYEGGSFSNPSYHDVCTDRTGHAEAVEVDYDPARVSYEDLLAVFWA